MGGGGRRCDRVHVSTCEVERVHAAMVYDMDELNPSILTKLHTKYKLSTVMALSQ